MHAEASYMQGNNILRLLKVSKVLGKIQGLKNFNLLSKTKVMEYLRWVVAGT